VPAQLLRQRFTLLPDWSVSVFATPVPDPLYCSCEATCSQCGVETAYCDDRTAEERARRNRRGAFLNDLTARDARLDDMQVGKTECVQLFRGIAEGRGQPEARVMRRFCRR
jgi:hypothetical protein